MIRVLNSSEVEDFQHAVECVHTFLGNWPQHHYHLQWSQLLLSLIICVSLQHNGPNTYNRNCNDRCHRCLHAQWKYRNTVVPAVSVAARRQPLGSTLPWGWILVVLRTLCTWTFLKAGGTGEFAGDQVVCSRVDVTVVAPL